MNKILILLVAVSLMVLFEWFPVSSQTSRPPDPTRQYSSESWRGEDPEWSPLFLEDAWPDTGLFADLVTGANEPGLGYPYHSAHVIGVSDTVTLWVYLYNETGQSISILSEQPELWIEPKLYDFSVDVRNSIPVLDTSDFQYEFSNWQLGNFYPKDKPDSLVARSKRNDKDILVFHLWGLPAGRWRIVLHETSSAPAGFKTLATARSDVWITKPKILADTLNAFASCFWRSADRRQLTDAISWTDSILAYNPSSIIGYRLRTKAYSLQIDTTNARVCLDSLIAIAERYGDPVLPDSADMVKYQSDWYIDMLSGAYYSRWSIEQPYRYLH